MAEKSTFIKIDRNIINWRWYHDANTFRVFIHLLIKANIKQHDFETVTIGRGQIATSYASIAADLGISIQSARTAIKHLKTTGELTGKQHGRFQVFSIVNYDSYQSKLTGSQQDANRVLTGSQQQSKNEKKERREEDARTRDAAAAPSAYDLLDEIVDNLFKEKK